ncbi:superoxide dismutase family protein [Paenibacillus sedimenti]|uniref:Superoxide dismutase family protein n=1 Tax=Paenibacillus sedimenti TaxID=2770274 RepID=A0A926KSA8_9BACL|nr:superoxide dismutase family protein [Paenibacillus sedimenti]MBD0382398.1 superoxide dismutase family protein [Paenibacillus sedimenti]
MVKKTYGIKHLAAAFLCGAICFSGVAAAATDHIEVSFDKLNFLIKGKDMTSADGKFDNNGTKVPESLIYEGTTYVPLRLAGNLIGESVYWEGQSKSVSVGTPYVKLYNGKGEQIGSVVLTQDKSGVRIQLNAANLTPGKHGFHIHDKPFTGFDFKTAAGHFNPEGKKHGHDNPDGHHLGDMQNLEVKADGTVSTDFVIEGVTLEKGKKNSILGKSFMIHAGEDDGKTDPAGNSGDRIVGGNIPE